MDRSSFCVFFFYPIKAFKSDKNAESLLLEPEILHVLAPPFLSRTAENEALKSRGKRHRSFLRKKKEHLSSGEKPQKTLVDY